MGAAAVDVGLAAVPVLRAVEDVLEVVVVPFAAVVLLEQPAVAGRLFTPTPPQICCANLIVVSVSA